MRRNLKKKTKEKKKGRDITRGIDQNEIIESEPTAIDFYARLKSSNAPCSFIICILFLFFFLFCFSSLPMPRVHAKRSRGIYDSFTRNNSHISRHIYTYTHGTHAHTRKYTYTYSHDTLLSPFDDVHKRVWNVCSRDRVAKLSKEKRAQARTKQNIRYRSLSIVSA